MKLNHKLITNINMTLSNMMTRGIYRVLLFPLYVYFVYFVLLRKNDCEVFPPCIFVTTYWRSGIVFYVSYIHSRTM